MLRRFSDDDSRQIDDLAHPSRKSIQRVRKSIVKTFVEGHPRLEVENIVKEACSEVTLEVSEVTKEVSEVTLEVSEVTKEVLEVRHARRLGNPLKNFFILQLEKKILKF